MTRPRLLDLCCGAGGAAMGYYRAGFDVYGVDIRDQPGYPFRFHQGDALSIPLHGFDAVHASPPCQRWAKGTQDRTACPDLIAPLRLRLVDAGVPWVIENVAGAPLRRDIMLCGTMFDLPGLWRHRVFETSWEGSTTMHCRHEGRPITVVGHGLPSNSAYYDPGPGSYGNYKQLTQEAMGIDWMNRNELSEAIPPAYTEWLGGQLMGRLING